MGSVTSVLAIFIKERDFDSLLFSLQLFRWLKKKAHSKLQAFYLRLLLKSSVPLKFDTFYFTLSCLQWLCQVFFNNFPDKILSEIKMPGSFYSPHNVLVFLSVKGRVESHWSYKVVMRVYPVYTCREFRTMSGISWKFYRCRLFPPPSSLSFLCLSAW